MSARLCLQHSNEEPKKRRIQAVSAADAEHAQCREGACRLLLGALRATGTGHSTRASSIYQGSTVSMAVRDLV